jgi:uncharacterized protein YecE (DUF72 family)
MKVFVGQSKVIGPISRYFGRFNFLEIGAEPGRCPRPGTLKQWREQAPKGFEFSVRLGQAVGAFASDSEKVLEFGLRAADALKAKWVLLQTPATLGPSTRNRERLKTLFERLLATGHLVAWEPRGIWDEDEVLPLISEVDVRWARDPSRYAMVEDPIAYARIPALGSASRVGLGIAERAGEGLQGFDEVYLVIEGDGAGRAAKIVRDIANSSSEEEGFVVGDDEGVEELSLSAGRGVSREESFAPDEEDVEEEDVEEEDVEEEDVEEEDVEEEDVEEEDVEEEDVEEEDEGDEEPENDKPNQIDDSDLPWAPGFKKGRKKP